MCLCDGWGVSVFVCGFGWVWGCWCVCVGGVDVCLGLGQLVCLVGFGRVFGSVCVFGWIWGESGCGCIYVGGSVCVWVEFAMGQCVFGLGLGGVSVCLIGFGDVIVCFCLGESMHLCGWV